MKVSCLCFILCAATLWALPAASEGARGSVDVLTMHADRQRTGWFSRETQLTPDALKAGRFGKLWQSPELDGFEAYPARLYASPLYVDRLGIRAGEYIGKKFSAVIAATSSGFVYAINAAEANGVAPGTILWKTQLDAPCILKFDGSTMGILSTPIIDKARKTLYVTSCGAKTGYQSYAIDIATGTVRDGWPISLEETVLAQPALNRNPRYELPPSREFGPWRFYLQRGALNLSPDDRYLYITMGQARGWLIAVDTIDRAVASTFSATPLEEDSVGGMWTSTGVAVDVKGNIYAVTGASSSQKDAPELRNWSQSVLMFDALTRTGFNLRAVYTPFNYCRTGAADVDLGGSGVAIVPALSNRPKDQLFAVGGKQGVAYLLGNSSFMQAGTQRRACSDDSETDTSLLAPEAQPMFGKRGPVNIFGPYSETEGMLDRAKNRSTPAYFKDAAGNEFLVYSGSSKDPSNTSVSTAPGLVSLRLVRPKGGAPYMRVNAQAMDFVLQNPGPPVISSNRGQDAVIWVLDENAPRSARLTGEKSPKPVLYAVDPKSLKLLWRTESGELDASGKYNSPIIANGSVYVGTNRIVAYGIR